MSSTPTRPSLLLLAFLSLPAAAHPAASGQRFSATYRTCMAKASGVTVAMRDCSSAEYARLDSELNRRYRKLVTSLPRAQATALRNAQRRWIVERDRTCARAGAEEEGGTLALIITDRCYLDQVHERVLVLRKADGSRLKAGMTETEAQRSDR